MTLKSMKDIILKTKTVVAAATLVTSFGVASNVHADEPMNETETVSNHNVVTEDSTKAKVETAKANLDNVNAALVSQEEVVKNAEAATSDAQATYDTAKEIAAQAQQLANEATSEAIEKAQANVTTAKNQVDDAQEAQLKSEETESQAKEAVKAQESVVAEAQEKVDKAQADVTAAQKQVDQAQAILDGTGQQVVIDEQAAAQADEARKRSLLKEANDNLSQAQEKDKAREEAISKAQNAFDVANKNVLATKSDLDVQTAIANQAQLDLVKAQKEYTIAENDYKSINTITMSSEYAKALKDAYDYSLTSEQRDVAYDTLKRLAPSEAGENTFNHNENDKTKSFDVHNVTNEQAQELSLFAADLINQARKAVGTLLVEVTEESAIAAQNHANYYATTDMAMWTFKHDTADLEAKYGWVDEDWAGVWFNSSKGDETLDDAKSYVYDAITRWIFSDWEWLHASSVVGTRNATEGDSYIGIGLSQLKDGSGSVNLNIFNTKSSNLSNFDKTPLVNSNSADKITVTYNSAKNTLDAAQTKVNKANQELVAVRTAHETAVADLSTATEALNIAKAIPIQTPNAQTKLTEAQGAYATAQERLQKANQALAALDADVKQKQDQVVAAKNVLAAKTSDLQAAESILTQAQDRLVDLQKNLDIAQNDVMIAKANVGKAQSNLNQAQNYLAKLQNAPKLLAEAKMAEEVAQNDLLQATKKLEVELLVLQNLQKQQAVAKEVYEAAVREYQAFLISQEQKRLQSEYLNLVAQGKQPVPIFDEAGKVIGYVANTPNTKQLVVPISMLAEKSVKDSNSLNLASDLELKVEVLPKTGTDSSAALTVAGMTMLATLGTVKAKRRKY